MLNTQLAAFTVERMLAGCSLVLAREPVGERAPVVGLQILELHGRGSV